MVPASAVIPAPIGYIKVVAVKNIIVGLMVRSIGPTLRVGTCIVFRHPW